MHKPTFKDVIDFLNHPAPDKELEALIHKNRISLSWKSYSLFLKQNFLSRMKSTSP